MSAYFSLENLTLTRGYILLFESLTLKVNAGEILHVKGVNGSGKTSLLMAMAGLLSPASGFIRFKGKALTKSDFYWHGVKPCMKTSLSVYDNLTVWSELEKCPQNTIIKALSAFECLSLKDVPFKNLSQGQQQRVCLARLLLRFKPLWLLDEPFIYLDEKGCALLRSVFTSHLQQGGSIILTSHHFFQWQRMQELDLQRLNLSGKLAA